MEHEHYDDHLPELTDQERQELDRLMRKLDELNDPRMLRSRFTYPMVADYSDEAAWTFVPESHRECNFCSLLINADACAKQNSPLGFWFWFHDGVWVFACSWCKVAAGAGQQETAEARARRNRVNAQRLGRRSHFAKIRQSIQEAKQRNRVKNDN